MSDALEPAFFRHEYGRLVAMLVRRVGARHLEAVEDAVQSALLAAVEAWPRSQVPDNPSAWLYRVAQRQLVGELRRRTRHARLAAELVRVGETSEPPPSARLSNDVTDDLLRMLFVCCDEAIAPEAQLVLSLKVLCGFDVREIAERLFLTEANVYKRLARARARLREGAPTREPTDGQLAARLGTVRAVLYTLFTEGYLSSSAEAAIRHELCDEAVRLATLLASHPLGASPETYALLALLHLHRARTPARMDVDGALILLEEQDRALWDRDEIARGLHWLACAAEGDALTRYHAEAGIAAEHCLAPSLAATRWDRIVLGYELLERVAPSPLHTLHRAVALSELHGPERGLALLAQLTPPAWLASSYQWAAVLADLHRRAGRHELAAKHRDAALARAPCERIRAALARRLR